MKTVSVRLRVCLLVVSSGCSTPTTIAVSTVAANSSELRPGTAIPSAASEPAGCTAESPAQIVLGETTPLKRLLRYRVAGTEVWLCHWDTTMALGKSGRGHFPSTELTVGSGDAGQQGLNLIRYQPVEVSGYLVRLEAAPGSRASATGGMDIAVTVTADTAPVSHDR
jgi:hypothetical protein